MRKLFYNQQQSQTLRFARMLLVLAVMAFVPVGAWAEETVTYDLWIGGTQVTSDNMTDVLDDDGTVSFEVSNDASGLSVYTLTLNGAIISGSIKSSYTDLIVNLKGGNVITPGANDAPFLFDNGNEAPPSAPNIIINSSNEEEGELVMSGSLSVQENASNASYTITSGGYVISNSFVTASNSSSQLPWVVEQGDNQTKIYYNKKYNLSIYISGATQYDILKSNKDDVMGNGTVAFDSKSNTLILKGATLGSADAGASIFSSLNALTIQLQGANTLYGCIAGDQKTLETLGKLIFTTSNLSENNSLSITNIGGDAPIYGFDEVVNEGTYIQSDYPGVRWDSRTHRHLYYPANQATTSAPTVPALTITQNYCYPIWVYNGQASQGTGYTQVTEVNQANVLGDNTATVSVNDGILVLNNASLTPQSDYAFVLGEDIDLGLHVWLQGTNTVQGNGFYFTGSAEATYSLDFERYEETTTCSFAIIGNNDINYSIAAAASGNVDISTRDRLVYNENMQTVYYPYFLSINGTPVTSLNRTNVFGDNTASVRFDGNKKLILSDASLDGIETSIDSLEIYLEGTNVIENGTTAIQMFVVFSGAPRRVTNDKPDLWFSTSDTNPGSLEYYCTTCSLDVAEQAFSNFYVRYNNKLTATLTKGVSHNDGTVDRVVIKPALGLIVDNNDGTTQGETAEIDYTNATGNVTKDPLTNVVIADILYTLNDTQTENVADDGFYNGTLVLNSTVSDAELKDAMTLEPGTADYADKFKGLTFLLPPGTGKVTLKGAYSNTGSVLCVKFGNQEPVEIKLTTDKIDYDIPYAVEQSTYGYIYLPASSSGAPAMMATRVPDRRIGPKSSVAGGLGGLSIKSSSIDVPAAPAASYMMCSKDMMATQMASLSEGNAEDGFSFGVSDITDLSDDVFRAGSASAPRRAPGYALPEKLTFIDLSETKIMGMKVSRTSGPFEDVPENTFIYMPAGNTVAADTKNVVIGSVCSDMELNGATGSTDLFKAKKSFTAAKATLKRSFTKDELATVCLPYSIMASDAAELGEFYTVTSVSSSAATLSSPVTGNLSASTAYVVKPSDNKTDLVAKSAVVSTDSPNGSTLVGVFKRTDYTSGNWYCYAGEEKGDIKVGQFVKMKDGAYVPPFRAYLVGEGSAPTLSLLWEGQDNDNNVTAVQQVKATGGQQAREGWWTLNGIRLNGQPAKAGMYVNNGRLVIVK